MLRALVSRFLPAALRQRISDTLEWRALPPAAREEITRDHAGVLFDDPGAETAARLSADWLLEAQALSATADGGYARHYSIASGWGQSYPETTGYIIPTLIEATHYFGDPRYADSARRALDWCVAIQFDSGAFQGGIINAEPLVPVTFNTGQILIGLAAGVTEFGAYQDATTRAANWLAETLDDDGCWRRFPTPFAAAGEKTYETHVAWGLLEAARALDNPAWGEAALKNIRWALTKQQDNGWFADCCLTHPLTPLTHTIGYALRGIVEGYRYAPADDLLAAAERTATALLGTVAADGRIPGYLDSNWQGRADWVCLTGCVQIAACWFLLHDITGKAGYLDAARRVTAFVRRTIHTDGDPGLRGGVKGSYPVDGAYGRHELLNWAAKFAIDANFMELRAGR